MQLRSVLNYSGADKKLGPEWILERVHDAVASLCNPCMRRTVDHCTSAGQVMKRAGVDKKLTNKPFEIRPVQGSFQPPRTWGIRIGASY